MLLREILHLKHVYHSVFDPTLANTSLVLLNSIYEKNLEIIFMNICIALRIICTIPLTVATAERSFSKLGNSLKTWQRASMSQDCLDSLRTLAIEHKLPHSLDFTEVINDFANKKARKM